jgi:isopentenyl diphosphate isomerase/L-lactate dehydrogenase-like FMN-dependent dehydrogenase
VSAFDFREGARTSLPAEVFSAVEGGDREAFDRLSFRPRMNVPTLEMDLSVELLGETLYTPIIVAPFADHGAFHPEAETATLSGATRSFTPMIVSRHSTLPFETLAAAAEGPLWFSVYEDDPVERFAAGVEGPLVLKGIESPEEADRAVGLGAAAIVVSTHGDPGAPHPLDLLTPVVDIVGGRAPILVDGSVRRGTDVLKALILGARGVLIGRPIAWGLAAYGADGVAAVLRLIQTELGRSMAMLGTPTLADLTRDHLRRHSRATS